MNKKMKKNRFWMRFLLIALLLVIVVIIFQIAPNYVKEEITGKINIFINNNQVTESMKFDVFVENGIIYMSSKDIANFLDEHIYYDNQYHQILTGSDTKMASLPIDKNEMYVNSSKIDIQGKAIQKDETFYLPISEMENVYNIEAEYLEQSNRLLIDSMDREKKMANSAKDCDVKSLPTIFSKTVDTVQKGENVTIVPTTEELNGWTKIRTKQGMIGYIQEVANIYTVRENMQEQKQVEGTISMFWDYYSEYASAPERTESIPGVNVVSPAFAHLSDEEASELNTNIGEEGQAYVEWAHNQGYKVWAMVSNNISSQTIKDVTSKILRDYQLREKLINEILDMVITYQLDGINIDFENIYKDDKEYLSRFIIELAPRLREYGKVLSVDVTAPDGDDDWSLCYDRNLFGKVADYVIFMAYDQYGQNSNEAGTVAGADWVEVNLKKFVGTQEEVPAEKLILGMPFYTREWQEKDGEISSSTVSMKYIDSVIPEGTQRTWLEEEKQYYVEYEKDGALCKMWLEEEESLKAKFALMKKYQLAGAAYWVKDMEKPEIWQLIEQEIK